MEPSDPLPDAASEYEKSLRAVMAEVDRIAAETKSMQEAAIDEMIRTREIRKKLEQSADEIAREVLAARTAQIEADIRKSITEEFVARLLKAGRSKKEICNWLNLSPQIVDNVKSSIMGKSSLGIDAGVEILQSGRGGTIRFIQGATVLQFHWEFGGGKALALIFVPDEKSWEAATGFPISDRMKILEWTARQVIYQKASGSSYRITDDVIEILEAE
jgi:hypothetical protein